jgi:hypothetical protein
MVPDLKTNDLRSFTVQLTKNVAIQLEIDQEELVTDFTKAPSDSATEIRKRNLLNQRRWKGYEVAL